MDRFLSLRERENGLRLGNCLAGDGTSRHEPPARVSIRSNGPSYGLPYGPRGTRLRALTKATKSPKGGERNPSV